MHLAAALIYWAIVAAWASILVALGVAYLRNPNIFGAAKILLAVIAIDAARNVIENFYFGLHYGGRFGLFETTWTTALATPALLFVPKFLNLGSAALVLGVLAWRWLPRATQEKAEAEAHLRHQAEALSQESEERRRLFETSVDLIVITDKRGNYIRVSPSAHAVIGYRPEEMVGRCAADFIHPPDLERTRNEMRVARRGEQTRNFECSYIHKDGRVVPLLWSGVWSEPEQKHYFIGRDMSERIAAEEQLRQLAHFDRLTGLPNRTSLLQDLAALLAGPEPKRPAVATFDIDGFKDINDTLGRTVGDRLLKEIAVRLTASAGGAQVYRSGGDEFALVFPDCGDRQFVMKALKPALNRIGKRFQIEGHSLFVASSVGFAVAPGDGNSADELIANAGLALHDAKAAGGNICRMFAPQLRAKAHARRQLDTELRRANDRHEFLLYFQPQFRSDNASVAGAEALLRWRHPRRGILPPETFVDALADSAIAPEIGRWALTSACRAAARWRKHQLADFKIAVNLLPAQFRNGSLLHDVERALGETGLPPEALELEITENIALHHDASVLAPLKTLRAKGIGIAFDDFGTGYASLSYLTRYPLTRIKIDRSFVQRISLSNGPEETAIVRAIIAMASNLGLEVTAEGVETTAQSAFLRSVGCHELQGFLFSKPLAEDAFEDFLSSGIVAPKRPAARSVALN